MSTNVLLRDLDISPVGSTDSRQLEVVAEGLSLCGGWAPHKGVLGWGSCGEVLGGAGRFMAKTQDMSNKFRRKTQLAKVSCDKTV